MDWQTTQAFTTGYASSPTSNTKKNCSTPCPCPSHGAHPFPPPGPKATYPAEAMAKAAEGEAHLWGEVVAEAEAVVVKAAEAVVVKAAVEGRGKQAATGLAASEATPLAKVGLGRRRDLASPAYCHGKLPPPSPSLARSPEAA